MCYCFIWILATYAEQKNRQEPAFKTVRSPHNIQFLPLVLRDNTQRRDKKKV